MMSLAVVWVTGNRCIDEAMVSETYWTILGADEVLPPIVDG